MLLTYINFSLNDDDNACLSFKEVSRATLASYWLCWHLQWDARTATQRTDRKQRTGTNGSRSGELWEMAAAEDANRIQNPSGSEAPKLSDLLERGWKLFEEVDTTNEPSNSNAVQVKVKRAITQLEEATKMVNQLNLFRFEEHKHTHTHTNKRRLYTGWH